jgi:hypothetical protein
LKQLQLVGLKQQQPETSNNWVFSEACFTQIQQLVNQHGALIIQQALMLLILKHPYMPTLISCYEAQHDGTGTAAMNHSAMDFVGVGGSTITGQSTSEIDTSDFEHATDNGFKQIGISKIPITAIRVQLTLTRIVF